MSIGGLSPFHLAIPVTDLVAADAFYCGLLGCDKGRSDTRWIDLNFFGHQVTLHLVADSGDKAVTNPVDGDNVPSRHFGIILDMQDWQVLADKLQAADIKFLVPPRLKFAGETGEQATMFFFDPAGNALEFKSFADPTQLFAH
jgi:extradiol dioxygenase family protein